MTSTRLIFLAAAIAAPLQVASLQAATAGAPLHQVVDLNVGESARVEWPGGGAVTVKLLAIEETRDSVRNALREARVTIEVDGARATLISGNYSLPVAVGGAQVDCPATQGLYQKRDRFEDSWGLEKDARLRLWPANSPWAPPGEFVYPLRQRWSACATQMSNEPSHVDGGDAPTGKDIYYHSGLDLGGAEGEAEVVAAAAGIVVSAGRAVAPGMEDSPIAPREDVIYIRDRRDYYYRYSHLKTLEARLGDQVTLGQKVGILGKEGASGGWSHLHFEIKSRQPSGKWGTEDGYAFLWETYTREYRPAVLAIARPHHLIWAGEKVTLDGARSWSASGRIERFEWTLSDGTKASGPTVERTYDKPGEYSEILKVVDSEGAIDYDFAVVLVIDRATQGEFSPTIHACYSPTFDIHAGDPVKFRTRSFFAEPIGETWDFGDGSPPVQVKSDGNAEPHAPDGYAETVHRFEKPGIYLVSATRVDKQGITVTSRLAVHVEP